MGQFTLGTTTTGGGGGGTCTEAGLTGTGVGLLTSGGGGAVLTLPVQMLTWLSYACCVIKPVTSHLGQVISLKSSDGGGVASGSRSQTHSKKGLPHKSQRSSAGFGATLV